MVRRAEDVLLGLVFLLEALEDGIAELVASQLCRLDACSLRGSMPNWPISALCRPLMFHWSGCLFSGANSSSALREMPADVVFEDELALLDAFEKLAAQAIDGLALLVHHVVVLEQVFARFEVLRFDGLLRGLDAVGDHARLDRHALFHAQALKQRRDPLLGEDAHQVVFKREEEARGAGIALAARASAQLVVDAARLVALGAEDEQPARGDDLFVFLAAASACTWFTCVPLGFGYFELLALVVEAQKPAGAMGLISPSASAEWRARGSSSPAPGGSMNSGLPPSRMSVPRPAMLVAMVTMPRRPAWATISASRSWNLAFSTTWRTPLRCRMAERRSDFSIDVVPTSTGCSVLVQLGDVVGDGLVFLLLRAVDDVGVLFAQHRLVGGDDDDFELVDLLELGGLGLGRAGHAARASCTGGSSSGR